MAQKKLIRFEAIKSFPNVLQYPEGMRGQWHGYFKNNHPVTLELACGKGEYTVLSKQRLSKGIVRKPRTLRLQGESK
jgi:tRNA G46 methylase TrmB